MATEPSTSTVNGEPPSEPSPAALLQQRHAQDEAHRPTIEDVVDEDDLEHPPPSVNPTQQQADQTGPVLSEKAAGKQKAKEPTPSAKPAVAALDTQSEEAFPALGGAKPRAPPLWGARKPAPPGKPSTNGVSNGLQSGPPLSSNSSSRASTPVSGIHTPSATSAAIPTQSRAPTAMSIPGMGGMHTERISFIPSQLLNPSQLRKPYSEIVRDINKRSKTKVQVLRGRDGQLIFEGKGHIDAVRQTLKEVAQQVGSKVSSSYHKYLYSSHLILWKQSITIDVPASTRSHIIGKGGSSVKEIEKRTGARVQFPKPDATTTDDEETIKVKIEGDALSAEMARREIDAIVNERTSTVNLRLREIPPELFPHIAGPHNANLKDLHQDGKIEIRIPEYDTWSHQPPPQAQQPDQPPQFVPDPNLHIQISGDRLAAMAARAQLENDVKELRKVIILRQIAIDRRRHQFIVGEKGCSLHDFFADTGCGIILPPDHDDTEFLTISGPPSKIEFGVNKAMDLASSMHKENVDLCRLHPTAPNGVIAHAQALTRYLQQRGEIEKLERQYSAHIVVPTSADTSMTWDVFSKEGKSGIHARSDITNLVLAHPPTRVRHVNVDPFFHRHLHRQVSPKIRDDFGVHLMLPTEEEDHQVVLVFEAPPEASANYQLPRQRPSPADVAEFEKALIQAQEHLLSIIGDQQDIIGKNVEVPPK
jgi:hypothetical protein